MINVKTYQDLQACGNDKKRRMEFILTAINEHKSSDLYKTAVDAMLYYKGENPTITRYEKIIYDLEGKAHVDMYTANHKIASSFFTIAVDQENSYLLGNGVTFQNDTTKDKLGTQRKRFDQQIQLAGEYALIGGVSFGFWNFDHIDVFQITEFVPLEDEENGALMAGIRFWQVDADKPLRVTLYEIDGYTDCIQRKGEDMIILAEKQKYQKTVAKSEVDGTEILDGKNYPTFPVVPLKNDRDSRSAICGKRNTIDALDLVTSNMVNNVDEGTLIYWIISNCGGMSDLDDVKFLDRLRTTRVAHTDDDSSITPQAIQAPYEGNQAAIDTLTKKLFQDFQALDTGDESLNSSTATGLKFRYAALDLKVDKFERQVTEFINGVLALAGIDDEPTYTRSRIINSQEEVQTVLMGAPYFDDEYTTQKLLTILGDADMVEELLRRKAAEDLGRFNGGAEPRNADDTATAADEAIDAAEEAVGKTLNGSQTSSLITVIRQLGSGGITEGQAVKILMTSIGVTREEALAIIRGDE